jgi:small-conductance mechanosensitive channel
MVAYDSDVDLVAQVLTEVAVDSQDVLDEPPPTARLLRFDEKGIYFELRAWTRTRILAPGSLKSDLNLEIYRRFRENGISFAEPRSGDSRPERDSGESKFETSQTAMTESEARAS